VVSTDGMFGFEARAFLKRLAKLLADRLIGNAGSGGCLQNDCPQQKYSRRDDTV